MYMSGRHYLIYGATGGIGSAIARKVVSQDAKVFLVARDAPKVEALGNELSMPWLAADVLDENTFDAVAEQSPDVLDGLVYAVGNINLKSVKRLKPDDFVHDYRLHALGAARAVQTALPALEKGADASVVFFSSVAAKLGFSMHASMGMAKGAVSGLTVSLAAELAPRIRVNAIAPSLTQTKMAAPLISNAAMATAIAKQHPMQRLGAPEDIASLACWLLGSESSWMTGQVLGLDGGRSTLSGKN